jgi:uncharacterized Rmd1/YagE family protein
MKQYFIQAQHLSTRLSLKAVAGQISADPIVQTSYELVYEVGTNSFLFVYNFGALVFFNVPEDKRYLFLKNVLADRHVVSNISSEDFTVEEVGELTANNTHETGFNKVRVLNLNYEKIKLVCGVLAESTALEYFEQIVERDLLTQTQKISRNLMNQGKTDLSMKEMSKFIGMCLYTNQEIISELYVVDAPDETWESQDLSKLYVDIKQLFEIETRYKVLEFKLKLIHETVDVVVEMLRFKKQTFFEVIITALIAVEVIWLFVRFFVPGAPQ